MKQATVEKIVPEQEQWRKLVQPASPEQPLIRVYKNIEKECFEAVFALELSGIGKRMIIREDWKKESEQREKIQDRHKKLLMSALSAQQSLDFVYSGGRSNLGKTYFKWIIKGRAEGASADDAAISVQRLWQNMNVIVGSLKHEFTFAPVVDEQVLREEEACHGYAGVIKRIGVAVNANTYVPMGFQRQPSIKRSAGSVFVVPEKGASVSTSFDSLALGASGCASEVKLTLSISKVKLSKEDLCTVGSALSWLRNGEAKQISLQQGIKEGSNDKVILESLDNSLELWLGNPVGYRVRCTAFSKEPIPLSFLQLVGSEIFSGPFTAEVVKSDVRANDLLINNSKGNLDQALDLQDCVNNLTLLPPLFPQIETLHKCNVKRSFAHAADDLQQDGILLGKIGDKAADKSVRFSKMDRSRHAYVIGATGTGKSTLLYNMIKQDIENGEGVCLIDPHGDLFEQVLRAVPRSRAEDVVIVDPSDFERSVSINFLETGDINKSVQMNFVVNEMIKIFDRLYDLKQTGGPIFEQYMRNSMLLLMDNEYVEGTLTDIPLLFEDSEFRSFLKKGCKNPMVESFWTNQAEEAGGDASLRNIAPYITCKLNQFTHNALLRPIIGQPKSSINFREIMDSGKILLVNLSKGMLGELDAQLLGMLLIGKLFSSAMGRVSMPTDKRRTMYLYIDEFQNFTTDSIAFLLSEARKFGLALTLANQNLTQLRSSNGHNSLLDSVLGNVGSTFMMRLGILDADVMQVYTKPDLDAQDLQSQPDFHVAARMLNRNAPGKPFVFNTMPAQVTGSADLSSKIKILSRLKFAQDTKIVESEIRRRRTAYKKEKKHQSEAE